MQPFRSSVSLQYDNFNAVGSKPLPTASSVVGIRTKRNFVVLPSTIQASLVIDQHNRVTNVPSCRDRVSQIAQNLSTFPTSA